MVIGLSMAVNGPSQTEKGRETTEPHFEILSFWHFNWHRNIKALYNKEPRNTHPERFAVQHYTLSISIIILRCIFYH